VTDEHRPPVPVGPHLRRKARRAMRAMALACDIDVERPEYQDPLVLWDEIKTRIGSGIPRANTNVIGDPFCLFLTGICDKHPEPWEQTAVIKSPHGGLIDEAEGRRMLEYLKDQPDVNTCEQCGDPITTWRSDMTRMSVRQDAERRARARSN
jgi:hypothetical protein